ncbi:F-box/FBD/LRR-repeat protein At1g13570 [Ricinus communis]|uniref:Ubiquitin-protein ligase, putative n=1 Tax=Ricinus communis TaxID=3988 RepID=B9R7N7_RICCO|nr:F-box/FBD/LRR-repeat protein At1g13570 [Ricinus communis]XP_015576634.1 F-box/FBD/LRR-repeat protein At1g13570 [Ricinus communis]EEF52517.1 ubiquitin-protein ligase, putative [Ricinus communis]|eukprot:XP_002510330.1 F-box/FBD/LRR-repeat protein At1g13570 [Ricinus communis]
MKREPPKFPCLETELDRISSLPGHVLDQILSQLSIRDAVRTSALSRKWRYKWAKIPHLVFDNKCVSIPSQDQTLIKDKLVNIIDHVLLLHNGPIQKFKLSHRDLLGVSDIDRWILHLSRSSIKEFILEIWKGQRYKVPSSLFSFEHLIHLELFNCLLQPPLTFKGFRSLKSLDLQHITLTQNVFENLIFSCPLLERLTLMNFDGFTHLNINAPNLQFFDIGGVYDDVTFENTFQLTLVSIGLYVNVQNDRNVGHGSSSKLLRFFANLPHIRRLEVQSYFLKYLSIGNVPSRLPKPCFDLNYLSIRINFNDLEENSAALCLLRSSPNVQELEMLARPEEQTSLGTITNFWEDDHWNNLFGQLRLVRIVGISGIRCELDFMNFLLSNSPVLERMTVKPASSDGGWELIKELLRFRRASARAEIIYLDP